MTAQLQTLSSAQTFVIKVLFPIAWIAGFGAATLSLWLEVARNVAHADALSAARWLSLAVWVAGSGFFLGFSAALKRVRIDSKFLYVSNYRQEIAVPLRSVERVTEIRWINIHPVTIHFRDPTAFGSAITFMPKSRWFGGWGSHPVVAELRSAAFLAQHL